LEKRESTNVREHVEYDRRHGQDIGELKEASDGLLLPVAHITLMVG
jgi:hypothetical protein